MKRLYTYPLPAIVLALIFSCFSQNLLAQNDENIIIIGKLKITTSNNIDWEIDAIGANHGKRDYYNFAGNLVWVDDGISEPADNDPITPIGRVGCDSLINPDDINDNVAFISRGSCEFSDKLFEAQKAGALAGIICNAEPIELDVGPDTYNPGLLIMAGGVQADSVEIPGIFISWEDRQFVTELLEQGPVSVSFTKSYLQDAAVSYSYSTPISQVRPLEDIQVIACNWDSLDLFDVEFTATITDPLGGETTLTQLVDTLFSVDTIRAYSAAANTSPEIQVYFDESYTPTEVGEYSVVFSAATKDGNHLMDSESLVQTFEVSDYTFSHGKSEIVQPQGVTLLFDGYVNSNGIWNMGSYFRTGPNQGIATHGSFALSNPEEMEPGHEFNVILYNADSDDDGTLNNGGADGVDEDRSDITAADIVALGVHVIDGSEVANEMIAVEFESPALLDPNGIYLLMVESSGFQYNSFEPPAYTATAGGNIVDYATAYEFIRRDAGTGESVNVFNADGFEYWNDGSENFLPSFPHGGRMPLIRLHTDGFTPPVSTKDLLILDESKFELFPTLTGNEVNLRFDLDKVSDIVKLRITDVNGRLLHAAVEQNVQNQTFSFDVHHYSAGTYFLSFETREGVRTKKFVVR